MCSPRSLALACLVQACRKRSNLRNNSLLKYVRPAIMFMMLCYLYSSQVERQERPLLLTPLLPGPSGSGGFERVSCHSPVATRLVSPRIAAIGSPRVRNRMPAIGSPRVGFFRRTCRLPAFALYRAGPLVSDSLPQIARAKCSHQRVSSAHAHAQWHMHIRRVGRGL